jgi:hypothetical protein
VLNTSNNSKNISLDLNSLGISEKNQAFDVWTKQKIKLKNDFTVSVNSHETKVYRFSK